ncbi:hypothetical protein OSTOST_06735 [Ostertagia ostertagi]
MCALGRSSSCLGNAEHSLAVSLTRVDASYAFLSLVPLRSPSWSSPFVATIFTESVRLGHRRSTMRQPHHRDRLSYEEFSQRLAHRIAHEFRGGRRRSMQFSIIPDHRLSVQDAAAVLAHTQSRATSGSRTDGSTDDECVVVVTHSGERAPPSSGRRRSSGRQSDGVCESRRLSRNDACRPSGQKPRRSSKNMVQEAGNHASHHDQRSTISRSHSAGGSERQGASKVNRNINRFSNFVKSGMEAYVLGESRMNGQPGEKHEVVISGPLVQWRPIQQYYTCTVDKPKKETKLKGLKSFIAYSLTSTLSRIQVDMKTISLIIENTSCSCG